MSDRLKGLFITGADTGVGKTYVGCLVARELAAQGLRVGVYKPVETGCETIGPELHADDAERLWLAAGSPGDRDRVCPQRFAAPLAPSLAAAAEGKSVDRQLLFDGVEYWRERSDIVLVEGAGGLLTPLDEDRFMAHLALEFGYPLLVVARNALGAINQTLQTLVTAATFCQGIPVAGVVLNTRDAWPDESHSTNAIEIRRRAQAPLLSVVPHRAAGFSEPVDWLAVAQKSATS